MRAVAHKKNLYDAHALPEVLDQAEAIKLTMKVKSRFENTQWTVGCAWIWATFRLLADVRVYKSGKSSNDIVAIQRA